MNGAVWFSIASERGRAHEQHSAAQWGMWGECPCKDPYSQAEGREECPHVLGCDRMVCPLYV